MDNLLIYLLKVAAGTSFLYLCYLLFFRNDTFYVRNRIYLIMILLLPALFPLLNLSDNSPDNTISQPAAVLNNIIISGTNLGAVTTDKINSINNINFFIWVYFSVAGIILLRVLISLLSTYKIIRKGTLHDNRFPKVIISNQQHPPFSFYPYAVIPKNSYESNDYKAILDHENAHIIQGHTFDMLLSELVIIFQWFNPFAYLVKRSIILNHEYLADNVSLRKAVSIREYQYMLLNISANLRGVPLAHNFSSLTKNRIVMINRKPTNRYAALKSLMILPAAMILLLLFSFKVNPGLQVRTDPQTLFSKESQDQLMMFIMNNVKYPEEAKNASVSGRFFVIVNVLKGGKIESVTVNTVDNSINVPLIYFNEIVITGYGQPASAATAQNPDKSLTPLTNEGIRLGNMFGSLDLPEWKDKNMEFALALKFQLKQ